MEVEIRSIICYNTFVYLRIEVIGVNGMDYDNDFESGICRSFFNDRSCDRIIYELSSKKRRNFFKKISHTAEQYIRHECIVGKFRTPPDVTAICDFLKDSSCYIISAEEGFSGGFYDLSQALKVIHSCGSPYIIADVSRTRAYLETEYDFSEHTAFFLMRKGT